MTTGAHNAMIGTANRERVRKYMIEHLGATNRECGAAIGLSEMKVGKHIKAIREEWLLQESAHPKELQAY